MLGLGLGPPLHPETEDMRALKGLLPPPQKFLLNKGLPQRGHWGKQGGARSGASEEVTGHQFS